jgi:hypothetical protein
MDKVVESIRAVKGPMGRRPRARVAGLRVTQGQGPPGRSPG